VACLWILGTAAAWLPTHFHALQEGAGTQVIDAVEGRSNAGDPLARLVDNVLWWAWHGA
jgi:hypothetical protein